VVPRPGASFYLFGLSGVVQTLDHRHQPVDLVLTLPFSAEQPDQLTLALGINAALATKRREHVLVTEVFAPCLELLWAPAQPLAQLS
jgi:hypothetical protein